MNPNLETVKQKLAKTLISAFDSCKKNDKLGTLTDLYVQINLVTKEVAFYNDEEDLITQVAMPEIDDLDGEESVYSLFESLLREVTEDTVTLDRLQDFDLLKPFSLLIVDENFDQQGEVYLLEQGEVVIEDSLFKDIDKELDDFLDHLLKE